MFSLIISTKYWLSSLKKHFGQIISNMVTGSLHWEMIWIWCKSFWIDLKYNCQLKHIQTLPDFHWLVLLDKSKKTTQIFPSLHHRCSSQDYPSHRGFVGIETGQRQKDTGLLGHSGDCYGQPDLIHELTASVILEKGGGWRGKGQS